MNISLNRLAGRAPLDLGDHDNLVAALQMAAAAGLSLYVADLQDANLRGANLGGANLGGANLRGADLRSANLARAILRGAVAQFADLRNADLRTADMTGAVVQFADLRDANLHGADLSDANLHCADLSGADLRGTRLSTTMLRGVDLYAARLQDAFLNWKSHDLMAVLLVRAADNDARRGFAGLILVAKDLCWDDFLAMDKALVSWALGVLAGCARPDDCGIRDDVRRLMTAAAATAAVPTTQEPDR